MEFRRILLVFIVAFLGPLQCVSKAGPITQILKAGLLTGYNSLERPGEGQDPSDVTINVMLQGIYRIQEGTLEALVWANALLSLTWKDNRVGWVSSRYGVSSFPFPADKLWIPDIRLLNSMDPSPSVDKSIKPVLHHDGTLTYVFPIVLMVHCPSPRTHRANWECPFTFGSWNYDTTQMDLQMETTDGMDLTHYQSDTWVPRGNTGTRKVVEYGSGLSYTEITYKLQILRK